jgi:hypothetical protein
VSFPTTPLVVKIEFAFGADLKANPATWIYQDRTADWLADRDLAATVGRADATSKAQPASLSFWLKNPTGDYTKGNPFGQFWPYVRKNTPCRITLDPGTGHTRQYVMYVTKWLPRWTDNSGGQPLVQVVANGVRRRLSQGDTPLRSPLYRAVAALNPLAHWSFEDGSATPPQAGSAVTGGTPLQSSRPGRSNSVWTDRPALCPQRTSPTAPLPAGDSQRQRVELVDARRVPGAPASARKRDRAADGVMVDCGRGPLGCAHCLEDPVTGPSTIGYDAGVMAWGSTA